MNNTSSPSRTIVIIAVIAIIAVLVYNFLIMPDRRTPTEKMGDAVHELPNGFDKAGRQLENRTPGERLGDTLKDAGEKMQDGTRANPN